MALDLHDCSRFQKRMIECPFRGMDEHDDDDDEDDPEEPGSRIPIAIPMRRQAQVSDNLSQFPVIAHGVPEMKKALERMAALQRVGELQSIPSSRSLGRGAPELISILAAIAITTSLLSGRVSRSARSFQAVRTAEQRVSKGFGRLIQTGKPGSPGGFGGMLRPAARFRGPLPSFPRVTKNNNESLRKLLGFGQLPIAGIDTFSETGFN